LLGVNGRLDGVGEEAPWSSAPPTLSKVAQLALSTLPPSRQVLSSASSSTTNALVVATSFCAFLRSALSSAGESSALTRALFLIDLARMPKRRVEMVSASL
jgi:hypothetical protein